MKKKSKEFLEAVCAIFLLYVGFWISGIGCPIKFLTGISCPGCGMTRAWIALAKANITAAFYYHPLVLIPLFAVIIYVLKYRFNKLSDSIYRNLVVIIILAFIIVYFIRMFNPEDSITVCNVKDGMLYKIVSILLR